jgi:hypothetical protein
MGRHVALIQEVKNAFTFWSENLKGRDHFGDEDIDGRIAIKWILL